MDARKNTREGGKERTAAARRTSQQFSTGDHVAFEFGGNFVMGRVERVVDGELDLYKVGHGNFYVYRNASEMTRLDDDETAVDRAVSDPEPLVMDDEPTDLGDVDIEDRLTAAKLDAANLLVRICDSEGGAFTNRVLINGITWLVEAKPVQD